MKNILSSVFAGLALSVLAFAPAANAGLGDASPAGTLDGCAVPTATNISNIIDGTTVTINLNSQNMGVVQEGDVITVLFDYNIDAPLTVDPLCVGLYTVDLSVVVDTPGGLLDIFGGGAADEIGVPLENLAAGQDFENSFAVEVGAVANVEYFTQDFTATIDLLGINGPAINLGPVDMGGI